jgi:hypothetical protein
MAEQPVRDSNEMLRRRNQAVTEQLIGELEAGRFDSPLVRRILAAPSAFPRLLRACFVAASPDQRELARTDIDTALGHGRDNPVVELAAGMLLVVIGERDRGLAQLERIAGSTSNAAERARQLHADALAGVDAPEWIEHAKRMLLRALAMYSGARRR